MQLHDRKIKSIIQDWQSREKDPEVTLSHFKKEVELYIYNFPRLAYKKDLDFCSEFYLYVIEQLDPIIKNYPLDAAIQFKTWFNYVLRNKFLDFYHKNKKQSSPVLCLDDYDQDLPAQTFCDEELEFSELKQGIKALELRDQLLIKLYYLPESVSIKEMENCTVLFRQPLHNILQIRKELMASHLHELDRIRGLSEKLSEYNRQLQQSKYELYNKKDMDISQQNDLLLQISKLESSRFRLINKIYAPNRKMMKSFMRLFDNLSKARYRLSIAQKRLRFELLRKKRKLGQGGLL